METSKLKRSFELGMETYGKEFSMSQGCLLENTTKTKVDKTIIRDKYILYKIVYQNNKKVQVINN